MRFLGSVDPELDEDDHIFEHSSQRANQPWEVGEEVILLRGVAKNLIWMCQYAFRVGRSIVTYACAVGHIAQKREDKEEKRKSWTKVNITT